VTRRAGAAPSDDFARRLTTSVNCYFVGLLQHEQPLQRQGAAQRHAGAQLQADFAAGWHAQVSQLHDEQEQSGLVCFDIWFLLSERWAHP
jgi:hypothetical protein